MRSLKNEKGVTIIALVVTVIVIFILAGISLTQGTKLIKKAKSESFVTNMITIRAKSKVYAEEVNAKTWGKNDNGVTRSNLFSDNYNMTKVENLSQEQIAALDEEVTKDGSYESYSLTEQALEKMGLEDVKEDTNYIVVYNSGDYTKLDVIYKTGITYNETKYYTLSTLQKAMGE